MSSLYTVRSVPTFQNKVYNSVNKALQSPTGDVELVIDKTSGLLKNHLFDNSRMQYDENYQNEQNHSPYFQHYLEEVSETLESFIQHDKQLTMIEIGCGKGYFLEHLRTKGYSVTGYDPTYEGNAPYIAKDYFGLTDTTTQGDLLILRHTMEHIENPFQFLHTVAKANGYTGKIFIEVPTVDWIIEHKAFWDIFYEHCNYFNESSFANLFKKSKTGRLFGGQYMYIFAELADLKPAIDSPVIDAATLSFTFDETFTRWKTWLAARHQEGIAIWGAGAKGSTFLNILDKDRRFVSYVVDVNPRKQGKFIAVTGHPIESPAQFLAHTGIRHVLVMNPNYLYEIKQTLGEREFSLTTL